jgi:hypothetical protein
MLNLAFDECRSAGNPGLIAPENSDKTAYGYSFAALSLMHNRGET